MNDTYIYVKCLFYLSCILQRERKATSQSGLELPVVISKVSNKVNSSNGKKRGEYIPERRVRVPEVFIAKCDS